jgi:hypothetical protein
MGMGCGVRSSADAGLQFFGKLDELPDHLLVENVPREPPRTSRHVAQIRAGLRASVKDIAAAAPHPSLHAKVSRGT